MSLIPFTLGPNKARQLLGSADTAALLAYEAAASLVGELDDFDPEALSLVLAHKHGLDVPPGVLDRIYAVNTLKVNPPAFTEHAHSFEVIVLALCRQPVTLAALAEPPPAHLAWGAAHGVDILRRFHVSSRELEPYYLFGPEVKSYVAGLLYVDGWVLAPEGLEFAQPTLDKEREGGSVFEGELCCHVNILRSRWDALDKSRLQTLELTENAEDVQIHRLAECHFFRAGEAEVLRAQLASTKQTAVMPPGGVWS